LAANSNLLSMGTITLGAGYKHTSAALRLGTGTNLLNADTINLGTGARDQGNFLFYQYGVGSVRVRGYDGSSRANLNIGTGAQGTSGQATNLFDVAGNYADLLFDSVVIGYQTNRNGSWQQTFSFDQGVLDALSVDISGGCRAGTLGSSIMNLGGGTVTFGPVSLTASTADGTLNITGGNVTVAGITDTGAGTGTLNVSGATLNVALPGFGNPAVAPIQVDAFNPGGTVNLGFDGLGFTVGTFPLISYGTMGGSGFGALALTGLPAGVTASLVDNSANNRVDINITVAPPAVNPFPTNLVTSVTGDQLNLSWPADHLGWELQSNAVSVADSGAWYPVPGSTTTNQIILTIDPAETNVFFRMQYTP
jgi:hypothetical protein